MKTIASFAAAAAIVATAALAAPAAQAGPFFHHHHHGFWGGPVGGLTIVAGSPVVGGCYSVKRRVFVPGLGVVVRRSVVCG